MTLARFALLGVLLVPLDFFRKTVLGIPIDSFLQFGAWPVVGLSVLVSGVVIRYHARLARITIRLII